MPDGRARSGSQEITRSPGRCLPPTLRSLAVAIDARFGRLASRPHRNSAERRKGCGDYARTTRASRDMVRGLQPGGPPLYTLPLQNGCQDPRSRDCSDGSGGAAVPARAKPATAYPLTTAALHRSPFYTRCSVACRYPWLTGGKAIYTAGPLLAPLCAPRRPGIIRACAGCVALHTCRCAQVRDLMAFSGKINSQPGMRMKVMEWHSTHLSLRRKKKKWATRTSTCGHHYRSSGSARIEPEEEDAGG